MGRKRREPTFGELFKEISEKIDSLDEDCKKLLRLVNSFTNARDGYLLVKGVSKKWRRMFLRKMMKEAKNISQLKFLIKELSQGSDEWERYINKMFSVAGKGNSLSAWYELRKLLPSEHLLYGRVQRIIKKLEEPLKKRKRKR